MVDQFLIPLLKIFIVLNATLVAVTGYGQPTDRVRSRQAGFASHLVKPIDAALLRQEIEAPLQKSAPLTA